MILDWLGARQPFAGRYAELLVPALLGGRGVMSESAGREAPSLEILRGRALQVLAIKRFQLLLEEEPRLADGRLGLAQPGCLLVVCGKEGAVHPIRMPSLDEAQRDDPLPRKISQARTKGTAKQCCAPVSRAMGM
jgi:hypothetical protein